ncbi:TatD family hydrolase [Candidatus Woesearchaeota archaeon]|nr:TatD family hydrolase [Candidatus Woesearchaeota archaeon]
MILADVHAHLDTKFFGKDIDDVIQRAKENNVKAIIANGVDKETNREVLALAEKYSIIKPALGLYPIDALEKEINKKRDWKIDEELAFIEKNKDMIVAVGEVGLDFKDSNEEEKTEQIRIFKKLIELAIRLDKPLIVHSRKAESNVIEILEKYDYKKIVMHCFSGKLKLAERVIANMWFFSIPTHIVRSEHMQKLAEKAPLSQLLSETDAPFLSPFKEQKNEPAFVIEAVKKIAEIKKMDAEEAANAIYMNYQKLFL